MCIRDSGVEVPGDEQGFALATGDGAFFVVDEGPHHLGEPHRQVGVEAFGLQQGDRAALLLQSLYLQLEFAVELVQRVAGPRTGVVGRVRVHLLDHLADAVERETERREPFHAQEAREIFRAVVAVAVLAAWRFGQQPDGVVVAQRAHRASGEPCDLARFHDEPPMRGVRAP